MRFNAKTLRVTLLVLGVVLLGSVAGVVGYSRWKAARIYREIEDRIRNAMGKPFCHDCTYAPNIHGRVPFRLYAKRGEQISPGRFALHDARVTLYSADGMHQDQIYGAEFEYDQKNQVVRALGEVQMDLQAPESMTKRSVAPPDGTGVGKPVQNPVHVRTSDVVYMRKLDVAATDKPVEIHYGGIVCTSIGADLDNGSGLVRLLRQVHVTGSLNGQAGTLDAAHAEMNRNTNELEFVEPRAVSGDRRGRAAHALLFLRKDGSVDHGEADGAVDLAIAVPGGGRDVKAQRLELTANKDNVVQTARLSGGVSMVGTEPGRPMRGEAQTADLRFNGAGRIEDLVAVGRASLHAEELAGHVVRDLSGDRLHATFATPGGAKSQSVMTGLEAHGIAVARFDEPMPVVAGGSGSTTEQRRRTEIRGDDLRTVFVPGKNGARETASLRSLTAGGHTLLDQQDTTGAHASSVGDTLDASFAPGDENRGAELQSAVQTGHVRLTSLAAPKPVAEKDGRSAKAPAEWRGTAGRAAFDGATEVLTLTADAGASAQVSDGSTEIAAREVKLHRLTGDGEASGALQASLYGDPASAAPSAAGRPVTHVEADRGRLIHSIDQAEFFGSAARPARLWQGASQVIAAHLLVDGVKKTLAARPEGAGDWVRANFAESASGATESAAASAGSDGRLAKPPSIRGGGKGAGKAPEMRPGLAEAAGAVRVVAARMDYDDVSREAVFAGGPGGRMHMELAGGSTAADRGTVFLTAAQGAGGGSVPRSRDADAPGTASAASGLNGSLERAVLVGHVELHQPERTGTAEQLTYTARNERYVLTGTPGHLPHVDDRRQGNVTGTTLLFSRADSSIVVAGEPGAEKGRNGRVRTELELKP